MEDLTSAKNILLFKEKNPGKWGYLNSLSGYMGNRDYEEL